MDAVKMLGRVLTHNTRPFDALSHVGEGRFLLLLDNVNERQLLSIARKFCFLAEHSSVLTETSELPVTVSIAGRMADPETTGENLLKSVEKKMLELQEAGGNQVALLRK
jgi:GGDEF domain-containing protein